MRERRTRLENERGKTERRKIDHDDIRIGTRGREEMMIKTEEREDKGDEGKGERMMGYKRRERRRRRREKRRRRRKRNIEQKTKRKRIRA